MDQARLDEASPEVRQALGEGYLRLLSMRNDRLTLALVDRVQAAGVRPLVLKGAATRAMLQLTHRPSADVDLLVHPGDRRRVERVLTDLGYRRKLGVHADNWTSADGVPVDLHRTIPRLRVSGADAWRILQAHRATIELAGGSIDVLDRPAHLVHLAIHATQDDLARSPEDLRRAVELADEACLDAAVALSAELSVGEVVAWSLDQAGLPDVGRRFGTAEFVVNAPIERGWRAFLGSPVHWEERRRRAARVVQMRVVWLAGRGWRVVTLRSNKVQRLRAAAARRLGRG